MANICEDCVQPETCDRQGCVILHNSKANPKQKLLKLHYVVRSGTRVLSQSCKISLEQWGRISKITEET